MILSDNGIFLPEAYVREMANIDASAGIHIRDAVPGLNTILENSGVSARYVYSSSVSLEELRSATSRGSAVVDVRVPAGTTGDHKIHAVIVDGIENNLVLIRDPLPEGAGSAYKISVDDFMKAWDVPGMNGETRRAVFLTP
jgi:hypothetical protein